MQGFSQKGRAPQRETEPLTGRQNLSSRGKASHRGERPLIEKQALSKTEVRISQRKIRASFTKTFGLSRLGGAKFGPGYFTGSHNNAGY